MSTKKALYIDMDGTLARFHDADKMFIEAMWTPGFYVNLKPFENLVAGIKLFMNRRSEVDVNILSAVLDTDPPFIEGEKNEWFDNHLPEIDKEHRIFTAAGKDKTEYIDLSSKECYLLDDYNKNLYEFEAAGGNAIKFRNDINHRGLGEFGGSKGNLWEGALINYDDSPEKICNDLESFVFSKGKEEKETFREPEVEHTSDFVVEDDVLKEYRGQDEIVVIPEGIREIGINAFSHNNRVKTIVFPDSLEEICSGAFAGVNIETLHLPEGLKKIDKNAFMGCDSLTRVDLPSSIQFLHNQAFDFCSNLKNINIENDKYFSVTGIVYTYGEEIFENVYENPDVFCVPCGTTGELILGDEINRIRDEAFIYCSSLTGVQLPKQLKEIGDGAFYACTSLEKIDIPSDTWFICDNAFADCTNLKSVVMPDNLKAMGEAVFSGCRNLSKIEVSDEALVRYCKNFNLLDEVFMTPAYKDIKERYEALTKVSDIDRLINNANDRCDESNSNTQNIDKEIE